MNARICTVCGREVKGGHPASCNGPNQRFVSLSEYRDMMRRPAMPPVDMVRFRAERAAAKLAARNSDRGEWGTL